MFEMRNDILEKLTKLCAEDLSNLLCISKIQANHVVGNRIVELLSKED